MADCTRSGKAGNHFLSPVTRAALGAVAGVGILIGGCTRHFYREQADREVGEVLHEKDNDPAWKIEQLHAYPDRLARFADPTNPDRPPMPPDDAGAFDLSPNPQRVPKSGIERLEGHGYVDLLATWNAENRARKAAEKQTQEAAKAAQDEPPVPPAADREQPAEPKLDSAAACPGSPKSPFLITLEQSVEMGLINSREYQDRREDLYLVALPVTLQRFALAPQLFAAGEAVREWGGRGNPGGQTNQWALTANTGFAKLFPTGGLLLLSVANQTVINLSSPVKTISQSNLNLDFLQPLLRGGGMAVTLEPLTQVERNLLYEVRRFARFRKEFFVAIAGGGGGSISGGTFVPQGIIASVPYSTAGGVGGSGLTPGVVPSVRLSGAALQDTPRQPGQLGLADGIPSPVSGYLGTLLQFAQIDLDRKNIAKLDEFLQLFNALKEGGDVSQLQVDQVEQQILSGRSTMLLDQQQYEQAIDQFKMQLGMPVSLPLELDGSPLEPLNRQFRRFEEVLNLYDAAGKAAERFNSPAAVPQLRQQLRRLFRAVPLVEGTRFRESILGRWEVWEKLSRDNDSKELRDRLQQEIRERETLLNRQTDLEQKGEKLSPAEQQRLAELEADIALGGFERVLRGYESQPWKLVTDPVRGARLQVAMFRGVVNNFTLVLSEARNERLEKVRGQWPDLPRLCLNSVDLLKADVFEGEAVVSQAALVGRLDLMNVRAQVVDAWRQVKVFANALLGVFNAQYHMDTSTPAGKNQPLNFGGSRYNQEIIINGELPLVRKAERNNYRAALIAYERERRTLQEAEDFAVLAVRGELRQLRVLAEQYRIQQRQVELAYSTVESSLDLFYQPPAPTPANAPVSDTATRAASLTQQLLNAQSRLPIAQNQLLTVWTNYVNTRMQLYRDIELMPLDMRGVWIDDVASFCISGACGAPQPGPNERPAPTGPGGELERIPAPKDVPPAAGSAPQ